MGLRLPALALLATAAKQVFAQGTVEPPATQTEPTERTGRARFFDPDDGQLDLSYFLENPRGFLPIPIVITEPAVGYGAGVALLYFRESIAGEMEKSLARGERMAVPDIGGVVAFKTANGSQGLGGGYFGTLSGDRVRYLGAIAKAELNLD